MCDSDGAGNVEKPFVVACIPAYNARAIDEENKAVLLLIFNHRRRAYREFKS